MVYVLFWLCFCLRKLFLKVVFVLNMFFGFMSMIVVYYILKVLNLIESLFVLILVYFVGLVLGFYIVKGFFDIILMVLDELVMIDGVNKW